MMMSFFISRRNVDVPASVPPVPTEQMKPSTLPSVCSPDLRAGGDVVRAAIVEVVPLVGEDDAVRLGLAAAPRRGGGRYAGSCSGCCRAAAGTCDQFRAAELQHVLLLLALRLRDHDQGAIAARVRDQRQPDAGVAGRALDDQTAGLDVAALLGLAGSSRVRRGPSPTGRGS